MDAEQKARIDAALEGFAMEAKHVPTDAPNPRDLVLKYSVRITKGGREVLTTEYSMGIGHIPGLPKQLPRGGYSIHSAESIYKTCKTGRNHCDGMQKPILPTLADVMHCLVSDADAIDHPTFESWAGELGFDPDSRKAEQIYRACLETALKLRAAVGDAGLEALREAFHGY